MRKKSRLFWELLWEMTLKEFKVRYKNTAFGFLWIFINPILQMAVIGFVFRFFIKEPIDNYYLFLTVGLVVWNFFSISFSKATSSIVNERTLIKKAKFPRSTIPLSIIYSNFANTLIVFLIISVIASFFGLFTLLSIVKILAGSILLLIFTSGISLLTSALNVRFRDVTFFVQAFLIVWFYLTPIVYSVDFIPRSVIWIWRLNPLTSIVQIFQNALAGAYPPGPAMLAMNIIIIVVVFMIGSLVFERESKYFDDWL